MTVAILGISSLKCFVIPYTGNHGEKLCRNKSPLVRKQSELGQRKKQRWLDFKCYKEDKHRERNNPNGKIKYFSTELKLFGKTEDN